MEIPYQAIPKIPEKEAAKKEAPFSAVISPKRVLVPRPAAVAISLPVSPLTDPDP